MPKKQEAIAKLEAKREYDRKHPQPDPLKPLPKNVDPVLRYHSMIQDVTSWSLENKKDVDGAFRYFENTWMPTAERYLLAGNYSDAMYMSTALLSQFPDFVGRPECQELLSSFARDRRVRRIVRGMMRVGREALRAAGNPYLNRIAQSFMAEVRNQPFYEEYRIRTMLEDNNQW